MAVIRPRFEEWVIGAAGEAGVRLKDLGLPTNPDELHRVLGANPQRAERLLKELRRRGCGRLEALTRLLREALKMARRGEP